VKCGWKNHKLIVARRPRQKPLRRGSVSEQASRCAQVRGVGGAALGTLEKEQETSVAGLPEG